MPDEILVVNHVGGHPDSPNDLCRSQVVFRDLWERRGRDWIGVEHNWIDLPENDFLVGSYPADVTIVHFVTDCETSRINCVGLFNISPHHSIPRWRNALMKTFSKHIYIWGNEDELNGTKIGDLTGYSYELFPDKYGVNLHIYQKI